MKCSFPSPIRSVGVLGLVLGLACRAFAQNLAVDWFTIDGGGGTSTGGVFSVSGTIGQPDAGAPMTAGNYSIQGGFWAIGAVQTPGAPLLSISQTVTNTLAVSWPATPVGWILQQNTNSVTSDNWSNAPGPFQEVGNTRTLIVNPPMGNRFYRLFKP